MGDATVDDNGHVIVRLRPLDILIEGDDICMVIERLVNAHNGLVAVLNARADVDDDRGLRAAERAYLHARARYDFALHVNGDLDGTAHRARYRAAAALVALLDADGGVTS